MLLLIEALLWGIRFMLGAALLSFMNVVAWRLPQGKSPLTGRSFCPSCGEALQARDLVPVFSWLFLRGRCRRCGAKIAVRYLLAEPLGGALAVGCTLRFGAGLTLRVTPPHCTDFQIDSDAFAQLVDENTAAVLINSPNNPSGTAYSVETLQQLANFLT